VVLAISFIFMILLLALEQAEKLIAGYLCEQSFTDIGDKRPYM